ncbi:hypothetical protein Bpfe_013190 [Biomphalaria pfeifferi]|uniref:C-type lectin domain-containing protein n=1 Tax=Biomphalaria pfeifferi TaxID=112525 RepID=A0AAD8BNL8_BIOPF|nr:hypothetical protein Bpfe_013190 [Biomphalaria pfeifferi]
MYILRLVVLSLLITLEGRGNSSNPCVCINSKEKQSFLKRIRRLEEAARRGNCPSGFIRYSRYCYLFVMAERSRSHWGGAKEYCREKGANLVTLDGSNQEQEEYKLFTGLIFTDQKALFPFDPLQGHKDNRGTSLEGDSLRWSSTQAAINNSNVHSVSLTKGPVAKWSPPKIQGHIIIGPEYLSCVVLKWNMDHFDWRFNSCWEERLQFICEARLGKHKKRKSKKRPKRDADDKSWPFGNTDDDIREHLLDSDTYEVDEDFVWMDDIDDIIDEDADMEISDLEDDID